MECYWNDPGTWGLHQLNSSELCLCFEQTEATRKTITEDGWIRTGDSGEMDAEGFIYLHDRSTFQEFYRMSAPLSNPFAVKDIIIRGGENIVGGALFYGETAGAYHVRSLPYPWRMRYIMTNESMRLLR